MATSVSNYMKNNSGNYFISGIASHLEESENNYVFLFDKAGCTYIDNLKINFANVEFVRRWYKCLNKIRDVIFKLLYLKL